MLLIHFSRQKEFEYHSLTREENNEQCLVGNHPKENPSDPSSMKKATSKNKPKEIVKHPSPLLSPHQEKMTQKGPLRIAPSSRPLPFSML